MWGVLSSHVARCSLIGRYEVSLMGYMLNGVILTKREFLRHETTSDGNEVATWG